MNLLWISCSPEMCKKKVCKCTFANSWISSRSHQEVAMSGQESGGKGYVRELRV